jgi:bifunctional non-homologous end joining protein LigD
VSLEVAAHTCLSYLSISIGICCSKQRSTLRALLQELGLPSWIKTTGSKGFHIAVPLDAEADFATVARFTHRVGKLLVVRDPENLTREFHKVDRRGRILVDTGRND